MNVHAKTWLTAGGVAAILALTAVVATRSLAAADRAGTGPVGRGSGKAPGAGQQEVDAQDNDHHRAAAGGNGGIRCRNQGMTARISTIH